MPLRNTLEQYELTVHDDYGNEYLVLVEFDREANGELLSVTDVDYNDVTDSTRAYHDRWIEEVRDKRWDAGDY